jgi:hypothetical protein
VKFLSHAQTKIIIHFERSPPAGKCYRRAIKVEGQNGGPIRKRATEWGNRRRKHQEVIEVKVWKRGTRRKRAAGGGEKKEATGIYRSRNLEGVPAERELRGRGQKKQAAGNYRSRGPEEVPVERELRGERRGVVRGGRGGGGSGGGKEGRKEGKERGRRRNLTTPSQVVGKYELYNLYE